MNYSALQKDQMMDIYIPSLKAYYQVKLVKVEDNAIVIGAVKRHQSKDDPVSEKLPLDVGKIYLIYFGIDENVYCGKTKLIAIVQGPKNSLNYVLEKPEDLTSLERRNGSRVPYTEKVYYRLDDPHVHDFTYETQGIDLSKGGMCLVLPEYYKPKTMLVVKIKIEDIELCMRAKIRWIKKEMESDRYIAGVVFQELFLPL
ncbi:MAG: PilZ domain-containing protein [Dethiobacteria bacterium]